MSKSKIIAYILMFLTVVMWGFSFLSIKVSLTAFPPVTLALVRFVIAVIFLFIILKIKDPKSKLELKDIPLFLLGGVFGITIYFLCENNGLKIISASEASIIVSIIPVLTLVTDYIFFKEKMTKLKLAGVILSVAGVYFVVSGNFISFKNSFIGYILMILAAVSWVVYSLVTKPLFKKYSQIAIVFYQTVFGMVFFIPFVFFEKVNWQMINLPVTLNVIFLGIFCSAIAYYFYVYAMDKLGLEITALFLNLIPVIAVIASIFLLKETITTMQIFGGLLVLISINIASVKFKKL
jgi:drug/metabolite transporter (DMT)-like permease